MFVKHWTCQAAGKALCRNACHDCIHLFPSSKYMSLRQISCDTLCSKARFHGEYQISTLQRTQFAIMWAFMDSTFQQESNFFNRNLILIWHLKFYRICFKPVFILGPGSDQCLNTICCNFNFALHIRLFGWLVGWFELEWWVLPQIKLLSSGHPPVNHQQQTNISLCSGEFQLNEKEQLDIVRSVEVSPP